MGPKSRAAPPAVAAFFDVEGTIVKSNIVIYYIYFATRGYSPVRRALWLAGSVPRFLCYALLDKISRSQFNQVFYRNYRGMDAAQLLAWSQEHFETLMRPRIFPGALAQIAQQQGGLIVALDGLAPQGGSPKFGSSANCRGA